MSFGEVIRQIIVATDAVESDLTLTAEERAALVLVGLERFERLRCHPAVQFVLETEDAV